jgi:hypothetical protein
VLDFYFMQIEWTDNIDLKAWLGRWEQNNKKALYEVGVLVHRDILAESRKKKTGRVYPRKMPSGRVVKHTAANKMAGESTARMTGAQNKARGFYADKQGTTWGVDRSIPYAVKNENEFGDMKQSLIRNQEEIVGTIANRIKVFLDE